MPTESTLTNEEITAHHRDRQFALGLAVCVGLVVAIPAIAGFLSAPPGSSYLGFQFASDDHLVYAAWMRQAMDFHFLMDNRFTTDAQPGLTINLYFFVLGLIAKLLGIALTSNLARIGFSIGFVLLLHRFVSRLDTNNFGRKLSMVLAVFGGGVGFLVWHNFGRDFSKQTIGDALQPVLLGHLPTDVWQPEGFVFPSMLTNGLFMVSLCLILISFLALLSAKASSHRVLIGAGAMLLLMNIHSYDVLVVGLAAVGLVVMELARRQMTAPWFVRGVLVALGALPAALWFIFVLSRDPVFQARAATETFSPNFRAVLAGYLPMVVLAYVAMAARTESAPAASARRIAGVAISALTTIALAALAQNQTSGYFLSPAAWGVVFLLTLGALILLADENPAWNLLCAWALIGMIAIYFPGLYQRKLAMGLAVPWGILAGLGIAHLLRNQERNPRNLAITLVIVLFSASSVRWMIREVELIRNNVSNTTVEPVYLGPDIRNILGYLNRVQERKVVLAAPGLPNQPVDDATGKPIPDLFLTPLMPDLNTIASGLTGSYTYAGHWSETPDYDHRRSELSRLFFGRRETSNDRLSFIRSVGATYVIAPVPEAFPALPLFDFLPLGDVVVDGNQFRLVRIR